MVQQRAEGLVDGEGGVGSAVGSRGGHIRRNLEATFSCCGFALDPVRRAQGYLREFGNPRLEAFGVDGEPLAQLPFDLDCGLVGFFGYEMRHDLEEMWHAAAYDAPHVSATHGPHVKPGAGEHDAETSRAVPDAWWLLADRVVAFDHEAGVAYAMLLAVDAEDAEERGEGARTGRSGRGRGRGRGRGEAMGVAPEETPRRPDGNEEQDAAQSKQAWFARVQRALAAAQSDPTAGLGPEPRPTGAAFRAVRSRKEYVEDVRQCQAWIHDGET